jgi:phospholipase/carboxylesterase
MILPVLNLLFHVIATDSSITENKSLNNNMDASQLHYLLREPRTTADKNKAIILLHGVGSNEQDLFGLADHLPSDFYILSVRGPFPLGGGRYAWYNVDFSTGKPVFDKEQELSSREALTKFVAEIKQKYKLQEVYLGGFSQGAIMSYSVGLSHPKEVTGVIAFSGRILEEIQISITSNSSLTQLKVFLSHGIQDNTLPIHYARQAKSYLEQLPVNLSYHEYQMGHQVNDAVLKDLNTWLAAK